MASACLGSAAYQPTCNPLISALWQDSCEFRESANPKLNPQGPIRCPAFVGPLPSTVLQEEDIRAALLRQPSGKTPAGPTYCRSVPLAGIRESFRRFACESCAADRWVTNPTISSRQFARLQLNSQSPFASRRAVARCRSLCKCLSAALLKKLRAYDRPQERGFIGRQMAAPGFDPETDVGASKDRVQPICWPHPVSPLAPASTATPPLRCSALVVLHCAPQ